MAQKTIAANAEGTLSPQSAQKYRIVRSPYCKPTEVALARSYARLEDALADMGDGLIIADDGHIAVFHERHEALMARSATLPITPAF